MRELRKARRRIFLYLCSSKCAKEECNTELGLKFPGRYAEQNRPTRELGTVPDDQRITVRRPGSGNGSNFRDQQ
jgi:hypothetical protein